jgi:hypothetical protein
VRDTLLTLPEEVIKDVGLEVGPGAEAGGESRATRLHVIWRDLVAFDLVFGGGRLRLVPGLSEVYLVQRSL